MKKDSKDCDWLILARKFKLLKDVNKPKSGLDTSLAYSISYTDWQRLTKTLIVK